MTARRRERLLYFMLAVVAVAAILVIAYKAHALGWSSGTG